MRYARRHHARQAGQSLVELMLTMLAFFAIVFFYVQSALNMGISTYIQYATFMSARALLSGAESQIEQQQAAEQVLDSMVRKRNRDRFEGILLPHQGNDEMLPPGAGYKLGSDVRLAPHPDARDSAWEQGVTYKFDIRSNMLPLIPTRRGRGKITLQSESWLGREPTHEECVSQLESRAARDGMKGPYLYDNGC